MYSFGALTTLYLAMTNLSSDQRGTTVPKTDHPLFQQEMEKALAHIGILGMGGEAKPIDDDQQREAESPVAHFPIGEEGDTPFLLDQMVQVVAETAPTSDPIRMPNKAVDQMRTLPLGMYRTSGYPVKDHGSMPSVSPGYKPVPYPADLLGSHENGPRSTADHPKANYDSLLLIDSEVESEFKFQGEKEIPTPQGRQSAFGMVPNSGGGKKSTDLLSDLSVIRSLSEQLESPVTPRTVSSEFGSMRLAQGVQSDLVRLDFNDEAVIDPGQPQGVSASPIGTVEGEKSGGNVQTVPDPSSAVSSLDPVEMPTNHHEGAFETYVAQVDDPANTTVRSERFHHVDTQGTTTSFRDQLTEMVSESLQSMIRGVEKDAQGEIHGLRLRLYPEHLGDLDLRIAVEKGVLHAHFLTQSEQVRALIEAALPDLKEQLNQQGILVEDLSVGVGDRESADQGSWAHGRSDEGAPGAILGKDHNRVSTVTVIDDDEQVGLIHGRVDVLV